MPTPYSLIQGVTVNKISYADFVSFTTAGVITPEQVANEVWIFSDDNYLSAENLAKLNALDLAAIYTKTEVQELLNALSTLEILAVDALPTENINAKAIYLLPKTDSETNNVRDEYIYVNGAWECIGDTTVNLDGYATTEQVNALLNGYYGKSEVYTKTEADAKFTVPAWAKAANKPEYDYSEIKNTPTIPTVPTVETRIWNSAE